MPLQRSAHIGALTDSSYVQLVGEGVAAIDLGFPCRYTHSSLEVCDLGDLEALTRLARRRPPPHRPELQPRSRRLSSNEALSRHRHRHVRIEGRAGRRDRADRGERREAAQDAGAAARMGRAPARARTGGTISPSSAASSSPNRSVAPSAIKAVGRSAIGPCMLPVDADGRAADRTPCSTASTPARRRRSTS